MRCSLLHRRCWPCAATQTLLILWNLFLRDNPTARKRKTRPHASHGLVRNAYWGTNWIKCTHFSSLKPRGNLKTLLSLTQLLKKKISHLTQHFLYGLLDPDKEAVDGGEDRDQIAQRSGDSCRHPVCIVTKLQLTWTMQVSSSTGEWFSPFFFFFFSIQKSKPKLQNLKIHFFDLEYCNFHPSVIFSTPNANCEYIKCWISAESSVGWIT